MNDIGTAGDASTINPSRQVMFLWGAEILRFLQVDTMPAWNGQTPAQRKREYEADLKKARELGLKV